jgi:hypothetical protein
MGVFRAALRTRESLQVRHTFEAGPWPGVRWGRGGAEGLRALHVSFSSVDEQTEDLVENERLF